MAPRISPPGRNAAAQALLELYQSTERRIIREIARKRTQGYVDYAELAALRRVRRTIQQMVDGSAKYVPLAIEHEFYKGKEAKKGYENALSVAGSPERDRVMEQLVDNLMGEVQEMAQTAYQSAEAQIYLTGRTDPGVYRQSVLRGAIAAQAEGRGALTSVEQVMQSLQQAGITAFVDKAGREWSLSAYGSMAVRTTVRQAQVSAVLTADDHDLWKIKEIGSTCPLCAVYEGRVYSKSGMNPNYPPLAVAFGKMDPAGPNDLSNTFLNIHPSCQHSLVKWTEDYKTDEEIEAARKFSSFETNPRTNDPRTEAQIEAYRNKERQRAAYRRSLDQFDRYTKAGIEDFPKSMATFLKHKQADDEKYKAWMAEYRKIEKPKKPEKPKAPEVKPELVPPVKAPFTPAQTISEAQTYADRFVESYKTKYSGAVDYGGIDVQYANDMNRAMTEVLNVYEPKYKLRNIKPFNTREKRFKDTTAEAAYQWGNCDMFFNKKLYKNGKTFAAHLKQYEDLKEQVFPNLDMVIEKYRKSTSRFDADRLRYLEALKATGRTNVSPPDAYGSTIHELGHYLDDQIFRKAMKEDGFDLGKSFEAFSSGISAYATADTQEYVAESFTAYWLGEPEKVDPALIRIFQKVQKK